ncbi:hypothetical protein BDV95DRAFT_196548 [Massariosphaeria phaeospora]|uniref:RRM domain-containing protein n=1 Tax=Massariosphaeria phaeospora TaxID=100035 RepID=A0A7C8I4B8_9PLEO|nr:hypothetical protein BDV95DRAFT_196548 [Massariosphaeria phaeospora]
MASKVDIEKELEAFLTDMRGGPPRVDAGEEPVGRKRKLSPPPPKTSSKQQKVQENRAVFITNLPKDITLAELTEEFSRYGIIDQGVDGTKRVKMYYDENGDFNRQALIVFFKKESVDLAIQMTDDMYFPGRYGSDKIKVDVADMAYKRYKDTAEVKSKLVRKDKKAVERNRAEMNQKLASWDDNDEENIREAYAPPQNKWGKVAVVKFAFTLESLKTDDLALVEIPADIREKAEESGDVTKVTIYDKEPEGIVTVRFKELDAAEDFCTKWNGKGFDGRTLQITVAEDRPKFRKSRAGPEEELARFNASLYDDDDDEEEDSKLDKDSKVSEGDKVIKGEKDGKGDEDN